MSIRRIVFSALFVAAGLIAIGPPAQAEARTSSAAFFYADLEPYGRWTEHRIYGTVWVPANHRPGWVPYSDGRWVWTSDYGWYWDSFEDFGWATYHYGRWVLTADLGWVWVPDDVWGPAWVDWRYSDDGYVGWAPMPPEYRWHKSGFVAVNVSLTTDRYAPTWIFVAEQDFARGDIRGRRVAADRNRAMLAASARVTAYTSINTRIVNKSIDPVRLAAKTKVRIEPVRLGTAASIDDSRRLRAAGSVPLFRPRLTANSELDLDVGPAPLDVLPNADVVARPEAPSRVGGDIDTGVSARGAFDRPIGGGSGTGLGGGFGGGLRIGR